MLFQSLSKENNALGKLAVLLLLPGAVDQPKRAVSNKVEEKDHVGKKVAMEKGNKSEAQVTHGHGEVRQDVASFVRTAAIAAQAARGGFRLPSL